MFRNALRRLNTVSRLMLDSNPRVLTAPVFRAMSNVGESEEAQVARYVRNFSSPDLDHWWLTKHINDLSAEDCIPDPLICIAVLKACRKLNDIAIALRFLELMRSKCGNRVSEIMPYMMQEIGPTMKELGVPTLEELDMLKPELACEDVEDM